MADCKNKNNTQLGRLSTPARNNYFYGKMMDVCHFEMEQTYFNHKRWLLNRFGLGSGVLCGLEVIPDPDDASKIRISPGVAIDDYGRELIVTTESGPFDPRQLTDECGQPIETSPDLEHAWICLSYHECPSELVPVLVGDCDTENECLPSTICERYRVLVLQDLPETPSPACPLDGGLSVDDTGKLTSDTYADLAKLVSEPCPEVKGPQCVPLAQINLSGEAIETGEINTKVRPLIFSNEKLFELLLCSAKGEGEAPSPTPDLAKVENFNWKHDTDYASMTVDQFFETGLIVDFTKSINKMPNNGQGWFIVTLENLADQPQPPVGPPGSIGTLHVREDSIDWNSANKKVTFKPNLSLKEHLEEYFPGTMFFCRVTLKSDFLIAENNLAVDGNFLGGTMPPSGNGVQGGDFESWFYIGREPH